MLCASFSAPLASAQSAAPAQIRIELPPSQEPYRERIARAATEALTQLSDWLGPLPQGGITIRAAGGREKGTLAGGVITLQLPWLSDPATMDVEGIVSRAVAMQYWPHAPADARVAQGIAVYLERRLTERLFNIQYARPGHHADRRAFFGGFVPWSLETLRLSRWNAVEQSREAAAFSGLERYLSWPVLQGALKALAIATRDAPLNADRTIAVVSAAAGQDLGWYFKLAFDASAQIDYRVTDLRTSRQGEPCPPSGCLRAHVTVARRGNAVVRGVPLQVVFEDGQQVHTSWDGQAADENLEFESPAAARFARLDPDGIFLLDASGLDNIRYAAPESNVPLAKWVSRWLVWLQDALLTYTMLL
jgi:hypothetical protein